LYLATINSYGFLLFVNCRSNVLVFLYWIFSVSADVASSASRSLRLMLTLVLSMPNISALNTRLVLNTCSLPTLGVEPLSLYTQSKLPSSGSAFLAPIAREEREEQKRRGDDRGARAVRESARLDERRELRGRTRRRGRRRRETTALLLRVPRGWRARVVVDGSASALGSTLDSE
jgi:hypothetical protein